MYIYPPRATTAISPTDLAIVKAPTRTAQYKYNDTHIMLDYELDNNNRQTLTIWDRHHKQHQDWIALVPSLAILGTIFTATYGPGRHLIDGGLIHYKHTAIKNLIAIWDIIVLAGNHQLGQTYTDRYNNLTNLLTSPLAANHRYCHNHHDLGATVVSDKDSAVIIPDNIVPDNWQTAWSTIQDINKPYNQPLIEGLVIKDMTWKLKPGFREINNDAALIRCRVTTGRHQF